MGYFVNCLIVLSSLTGLISSTTAPLPKCCLNEVYSECGNNACQNTCEFPSRSLTCKAGCQSGCICADGYLRNSKGVCVLKKDCDCLKPNEIFSQCDNIPCQNTCKEPDLITRCTYIPGCYPGCICKPGFLRNENGFCVPQRQCYRCKQNEKFQDLGSFGCENTCESPRKAQVCFPGSLEPGCFCLPGYVRNSTGSCVLEKDCPPKCGPNEMFSCGSACDTTCATLGDTCPIVNIKCVDRCYCIEGYARDDKDVCIPITSCPPKFKCTLPNQIYNGCPGDCPPEETCESHLSGIAYSCAAPEKIICKPRCECQTGFLRKVPNGDCIKPNQCCNDPNAEIVSCPNPCPGGTCESPKFADCKAPCKIRGCQCKQGYVKDSNGKCILFSKCPVKRCTGLNEEYAGCCPLVQETCATLGKTVSTGCKPGCRCKLGFVRDCNGKCIKKSDCPK